jgi:CpeT/CpcT family (DUF1001)
MAGLLMGACVVTTGKEPDPEVELQELVSMLPGHYDNTAQVQSDVANGVQPPHEAVALDIVPIDAIMIGQNVFYVQESIAGDPRRILGQKLMVFGVAKKEIVQTDYSLAEPYRWRDGQRDPDMFKGLVTQDVRVLKGCSLRWKRSGAGFAGANEPKNCHARGYAAIEARAELGPEGYATAELAYDKPGHLAMGRMDDSFYRFRRLSQ